MTQPSRSLVVLVTGALVAVGTPVLAAPPEPSSTQDLAESRHTVGEKGQRTERVTARLKRAKAELTRLGERAERARKRQNEEAAELKRMRRAWREARQQAWAAEKKYEAARDGSAPAETARPEREPMRLAQRETQESVQSDRTRPEDVHAEKTQAGEAQTEGTAPEKAEAAEESASQYLQYPQYARYASPFANSLNARVAEAAEQAERAERAKRAEDAQTVMGLVAEQKTQSAEEARQAETWNAVETADAQRQALLERLETARTKAVERRTEARRAYESQKKEFAAARKAKNEAEAAYEKQAAEVARLRKLKKQLVAATAAAQGGVVSLADRRSANAENAVARLKKGKNRHFSRGAARGRLVVQSALKWIGTPYSWGGGNASGPTYGIGRGARTRGFDCSGLALYSWAQVGVKLDHYTGSQWNSGPRIPLSMLSPGDLVFFARNVKDPDTIHHVGIFVGRGRMVEAPYTGERVRISSIWRKGLIGAVRPA